MKHIVVFASGSGTNFQALIDAVNSEQIHARLRGLVSNKSDNKALERAKSHGIDSITLSPSSFESKDDYVQAVKRKLKEWETDLIVLAGYMLKIPAEVIQEYEGKIINIHPSLLPKFGGKGFYGLNVHRAVIESGEKESGCTVHVVTEEYDKGPIIAQLKVPVHASDDPETLAQRVLAKEHELLPKVVHQLIND